MWSARVALGRNCFDSPGFRLKLLAADPYAERLELEYIGARPVPLAELMAQSDFVVITCLLNEETRGLVARRELALMKSTAYLVNVARGPIVNEKSLYETLAAGASPGPAWRFQEPTPADNPILKLDNVIVSPTRCAGPTSCSATSPAPAIGAIVRHAEPEFVVNPAALVDPRARVWLKA